MLGISSYKPKFQTTAESFINEHQSELLKLIGKKITRFWIMWETNDDIWMNDAPIILEIENKRYEFTAYQLDEFSLTINSFELSEKLDWYGMGNEMPLEWRENGKQELIRNLNKPILDIRILTYNFISEFVESGEKHETGNTLTGIEFVFKKDNKLDTENYFSVYNALDQNGIEKIEIKQGNQIGRISITGYNNAQKQ